MSLLPEEIRNAWDDRDGAVVLTTVSRDGAANSIYATCVGMYENKYIVVADNYFDKTRKNILDGSAGVVLFITKAKKAYQIKGSLEYHESGKFFDFMKSWNPEQHPGYAAVVLIPEKAYSGAKKIC
ncbi:MAG: pyridoxamine 5'-phosphate oxidase family protein [Victivallaceae bacterium]|nr:pyridoxamine 5'-phosphate oxidase family protein [Victivallaceae bacterium]